MSNKIFVMLLTMFLSFVITQKSFGAAERAMAAYPELYAEELLKMPYSTIAPYMNLDRSKIGSTAGTPARIDYYPTQYFKEYFHRDKSTDPIRDYRYYEVKTFAPDRLALKQGPIRDFRKDMWVSK